MKLLQIQHYCTVNTEFHYDRPRGLNEYVLIISHGEAFFHSNGEKYLLKPNQLFLYDKFQPQLFYSSGTTFCHDWFHFDMSPDDLDFFNPLEISFGIPITLSNPYALSEMIKIMASEFRFDSPHRNQIVESYMRCFFMKLSDMLHSTREEGCDHPYYQCLCALRNELYSFPYHEWNLNIMAKKANFSKSWLQHSWKKIFGISYQDDLIKSRLEYAKNLLYHTNYSIERIADHSGYNSYIHFVRQFKQETGMTPTVYRKLFVTHEDSETTKPKEFEQKLFLGKRLEKKTTKRL